MWCGVVTWSGRRGTSLIECKDGRSYGALVAATPVPSGKAGIRIAFMSASNEFETFVRPDNQGDWIQFGTVPVSRLRQGRFIGRTRVSLFLDGGTGTKGLFDDFRIHAGSTSLGWAAGTGAAMNEDVSVGCAAAEAGRIGDLYANGQALVTYVAHEATGSTQSAIVRGIPDVATTITIVAVGEHGAGPPSDMIESVYPEHDERANDPSFFNRQNNRFVMSSGKYFDVNSYYDFTQFPAKRGPVGWWFRELGLHDARQETVAKRPILRPGYRGDLPALIVDGTTQMTVPASDFVRITSNQNHEIMVARFDQVERESWALSQGNEEDSVLGHSVRIGANNRLDSVLKARQDENMRSRGNPNLARRFGNWGWSDLGPNMILTRSHFAFGTHARAIFAGSGDRWVSSSGPS